MEGMNIAYNEEEKRGIIVYNLWALALTLFLILGLILAVSAAVVAPAIASFVPLPGGIQALLTYAPWPILFVLTIFGLGVLYRYGPSRAPSRWRWITPGAFISAQVPSGGEAEGRGGQTAPLFLHRRPRAPQGARSRAIVAWLT
jgi:membrane protein